jgi:hypothetical protein
MLMPRHQNGMRIRAGGTEGLNAQPAFTVANMIGVLVGRQLASVHEREADESGDRKEPRHFFSRICSSVTQVT